MCEGGHALDPRTDGKLCMLLLEAPLKTSRTAPIDRMIARPVVLPSRALRSSGRGPAMAQSLWCLFVCCASCSCDAADWGLQKMLQCLF